MNSAACSWQPFILLLLLLCCIGCNRLNRCIP
jgi:hypothetical protein